MCARKVPVFLEPTKDRKIVVFGGGMVAYRKCMQFEGFYIVAIAENTVPELESACDEVIRKRFTAEEIPKLVEGAFIAVAATNSKELNKTITDAARATGIMINSAHGGGDVLLPSSIRREGYTVSVSSEGSVPAFPPYVANYIDKQLGEEFDAMLALLKAVRNGLPDRIKEQSQRAKYLAEVLACEPIWDALKEGEYSLSLDLAEELEGKYH